MPESAGEFARIERLLAALPHGEGVVLGPGDDAAVLRLRDGHDLVATTDTFVEGRHFRRDLHALEEAGVRCAAANLSDLAAMAAEPRWALVSLVVPRAWGAGDASASLASRSRGRRRRRNSRRSWSPGVSARLSPS